jgi:type 2 lantibiotic biosynthesis protein LanM
MTQREAWLESARSIGVRLCRDALWAGSRCNWLGCSMELVANAWIPVQKSFGGDLYAGTSGISLFLADLYSLTGERIFRQTCEGALSLSMSRLDEFVPETSIGFYSGLTGVSYAFVRAGERIGNEALIAKGMEILGRFAVVDLDKQGLDVVSGVAGAIPVFLKIRQKYQKNALLEAAIRAGEYLLSKARHAEAGWSWDTLAGTAPAGQKDLTGFSHGTAGIGWTFLELHLATGDAKFYHAAEQAFQYERHWFDPQQQNWPDFRSFNTTPGAAPSVPSYTLAWCHGAPGIGLSRLRAYALTGVQAYREEAEAAIRTTTAMLGYASAAGQANYSLCHGNAGNAELLLMADKVLGGDEHGRVARQMMDDGIGKFPATRTPWPCGVPGGWETPNLMLGTAGTGHFLLRLYDPEAISPVVMVGPE